MALLYIIIHSFQTVFMALFSLPLTQFDPTINVKTIINKDWPRITSDPELKKHYRENPQISYKHSPNLSQLLCRAKLEHTVSTNLAPQVPPTIRSISFPAKNIKCKQPQCGTCGPTIRKKSHQTKQYYEILDIFSCDITQAIYLLECNICHKQYIGETHTSIRIRMRHHRNMAQVSFKYTYLCSSR